jgi:hypothetical protein
MRLAALTTTIIAATLAGCQALAPEPDIATLPHATVADSHADVGADRVDTFRVLEVNGRRVLDLGDQPIKKIGHDFTQLVAAGRPVRVEVEGLAFYNNTARRMFWDPMHVQGVVEFVPAADAKYVLHGSVTPDLSSVWIENADTHEVVGAKVSAVGRGVAPPADAASAGATLRSGGA